MMSDNDKTKLEETIRDILSLKNQCVISKFVKNDGIYHHLYDDVMEYTKFMNMENIGFDFDLKTRLFFISKGWRDFPKCKHENCNNKVINFHNVKNFTYEYAYPDFCSKECRYHKKESAAILEKHRKHIEELSNKSDEECIKEIVKICSEHPTYPHRLIHNDGTETKHLYDFIIRKTSFLDDEMTIEPKFNTRIYWIVNGLTEFPRCHHCGHIMNDINPYSFASGYPHFCSYKCELNATKEELKDYYETYSKSDLDKYNSKTYSEMEEELREFVGKHREYSIMLRKPNNEYHYLYKFVLDSTKFLDDFYTFKTRVFFIFKGWKEEQCCHNENCGKVIKKNMRSIYEKFPDYCRGKCSHGRETIEKTMNTIHKRYGDEYNCSLCIPEAREKAKKTLMEHYGVESSGSSPIIQGRIKKTMVERYGYESALESPEIREKIHETVKERYGVDSIAESTVIQDKIKHTCLERYGCENVGGLKEVSEKRKRTNLMRYGCEHPTQNHEIFKKQQKRYTYNGITFHSSWELAYFIWLTDNGIEFEYQPDISFKYYDKGNEYSYFPDFMVEGKTVEINGNQFFKNKDITESLINPYDRNDDTKELSKQKCMKDNDVIILTEKEIKPYIDYVKKTYGKNYLKSFKRV